MCSIAGSLEQLDETFYDLNDVTTDNGNCRQSHLKSRITFVVISGIPLLYWHSMFAYSGKVCRFGVHGARHNVGICCVETTKRIHMYINSVYVMVCNKEYYGKDKFECMALN